MGPLQLLLCLLSAGILKSASQHLRIFEFTRDTFRICQNKNMKLATLYDEEDAKFVYNNSATSRASYFWVGIHRKNMADHDYPLCPSNKDEKNCSEELSFTCETGLFVEEKLNWCSARQYCQYHLLGDLDKEGDKMNRSEPFWIGGSMTDDWAWVDGGCSVFRDWEHIPDNDDRFAYVKDGKLTPQEKDMEYATLCSEGDSRIVVIRDTVKTWEQALDYCDRRHSGLLQIITKEDQRAVEQWLNSTGHGGPLWVGLRQSRVFGFWIWKDRMVSYSNWENGTHPEMPLSHNCGVIETEGFKWKDHNCLHPLPFICEERIVWGNH